jgi:glycosyltransferase involved in cell wall biosynthesis
MFVARLLTSRATVITEHDVPTETPGLYQRVLRAAMDRSADAIIAVSRRNAGLRRERIPSPELKLAAVLNGAPTADVPAANVRQDNRRRLRGQLNIDPDALVIGSLVRLAEGKGLNDLIRAFAMVCRDHASTLLLVGDGPLRSNLESLARDLGVSAHVRFAGHQVKATQFLDAMDVFVLAVPAGSMSMALLEAMARGLPSVITYCGPEEPVIDGETGLCAPPSDPDGLARILARISNEPELRMRLGRAAENHVMRHFSVERVADDLLELYEVCRSGNVPDRLRASRQPESVRVREEDCCAPAGEHS